MSKKLLFILGILALLLLAGYFYIRFSLQSSIKKEERQVGRVAEDSSHKITALADLRPLFIKRLELLVKSGSKGLYDLSIDSMTTDVLSSTASLHNVVLSPNLQQVNILKANGQLPGNLYHISFEHLLLEGVNLDDVLSKHTMKYTLVKIVRPLIRIEHHKTNHKQEEEPFSQRFLEHMKELSITKLVVEEGTVITSNGKKKPSNQLKNVQMIMDDILLNQTTRNDKQRFLFAKKASLVFHNYRTTFDRGLYQLKVGTVRIEEPQRLVSLKGLTLATPLSKEQFEKRLKFRKELFRLSLPFITVRQVNWWDFFNGDALRASEVMIKGGKLTDYLDRSLPPASRMGQFPNQLLMKIPIQLHIDRLSIRDMDFAYTELNPVSKQSGTIHFNKIRLDAHNLTNLKSENGKPFTVDASSLLMHLVPVQVNLRFSLSNYKTGAFTATIRFNKEVDATLFNSFIMPLGMTKIEKGRLQKLEATMKGDQWQSNGQALIVYKDLKLALLEKDKGKDSLDKKSIKSFIANTFIIKDRNPQSGKEPKTVDAGFQRDPEAGYFMLVWKTILVGALKTMGAPTKIAYKKSEN